MKYSFLSAFCFILCIYGCSESPKQQENTTSPTGGVENIIVITTDGLRWQDLYTGMDSVIASNASFKQSEKDSSEMFEQYWSPDPVERRKKLMPFFWDSIGRNGQLYGNRLYNNK